MINLLPPDVKQGYKFGRLNVTLRRWVIICLIALLGLGGITTFGLVQLHQSKLDTQNQIASAKNQIQKENYSGVQTQIQDISNSFKLVVKVLGQEVLFSKLLKQVAAIIPANANLTGLQISQTQKTINISAEATSYNTATQVEANLADPANGVFSHADLVSVTCNSKNTINPQYPCSVIVNALLGPNTPYLFINSKGVK
ncbi:MAG TPA: PilN domain-containing protein [Patescibacteria group bacterium]|nr:PilN domain-containing protein [Patescibacteria group bacterium]